MDATERQVIDELFGKVKQAEGGSGARDPQAEARIREHLAAQPAAPYYMAQAILIQEQALKASPSRCPLWPLPRQASTPGLLPTTPRSSALAAASSAVRCRRRWVSPAACWSAMR